MNRFMLHLCNMLRITHLFLFLLLFVTIGAHAQKKNQIAVIGTFHFHLVQSQFGIAFDINSKEKQSELEALASEIAAYKPTKIFVEWEYNKQPELDTLYRLYLADKSGKLIKERYGANETMYFDSEVQQLGFRIASKLGQTKLYSFDYLIPEPNDTIMSSIQKYNQTDLMTRIQKEFGDYSASIISKFGEVGTIKGMLQYLNSNELERRLNSGYISLFNKAGTPNDLSGAYFVSERYKRNLFMYSLIQNQCNQSDERILVLVGAQHAAGIKPFIKDDSNFQLVDMENIIK